MRTKKIDVRKAFEDGAVNFSPVEDRKVSLSQALKTRDSDTIVVSFRLNPTTN